MPENAEETTAAANGDPGAAEENNQPTPDTAGAGSDSKISAAQAGLMLGVALLFDGAQFVIEALAGLTVFLLPLGIAGGWVVDIFAWLTFFLWLHSLGLSMIRKGGIGEGGLGKEPFVIIALAFGIEFIPIINALPAWTAAIATLIFRQRVVALASMVGPGGVAEMLQKKTNSKNE